MLINQSGNLLPLKLKENVFPQQFVAEQAHWFPRAMAIDNLPDAMTKAHSAEDNASEPTAQVREALVPVTAIGASAGGLEPIEQFFDSVPADTGCAFIIIQHLSPDFRSLMDELLARHSTMEILRIEDNMQLQPNCIYLNPPRTSLSIKHNRLNVELANPRDVVYLPIDEFFNSLALDRGENAIALVLSGTGSDGTKGCNSILKAGGTVLVQDPNSTKFAGMPRSAIAGAECDLVAEPTILAQGVQRVLKGLSLDELDTNARQRLSDPYLDVLSMLLYRHGTDFLQYKDATIKRRIERRAHMHDISDLAVYRDLLDSDPAELQELYADLLIEVTEFFRDQPAFELLQTKVVPALTANLKSGAGMRVWVPGCASGEEAYSIAILLQEQARHLGIYLHLKILATDIHVRSMNQASSGIYELAALGNVPRDIIHRYFDCADGQAQIKPAIRNMVFFSTHDVTRDPPFTRIDLISCRNLLIYLKDEAQEKVMNLLHFSLRKDGFLFLGPSEHIGSISNEFDVVSEKWRIFKKRRDVKLLSADSIFRGTKIGNALQGAGINSRIIGNNVTAALDESVPFRRAQRAALERIVERHAPPGFLLSTDGSIAHIFGNAAELVPMKAGNFSKRIVDLIRPELKVVVTAALDHGKQKGFEEFHRAAYVKDSENKATTYQVSLVPIEVPGEATQFNLLSIEEQQLSTETGKPQPLTDEVIATIDSSAVFQQRISMLEHSLQASEQSLQSTIEELETSNEELQSTNEELMSSNEELQSTNEELHSVNEELHTVSAEHQRKNDDLTERETDLHVLLEASKIGTIHLDEGLCLRRYTNNARNVFNIMPQDIGRPIHHITVQSSEHDILGMIEQANQNKKTEEVSVTVTDSTYLLRVMPYNSKDNGPGEVLVTIIDISAVEKVRSQLADLGRQLEEKNTRLESANESLNQFAFIASHDLQEPLRKIQQFSSFLRDDLGKQLNEDTLYHLNVVVDASERMSTLIYDLLRYSGASQEEPKVESVNLNELLNEVVKELEMSITESKARIQIGALPTVQGDKALLRQLFINLVGNSIKYRSTERTPIIKIDTLDKADDEGIVLEDNGIGFSTEFAKKIFDPFTRLHNNKQYKGNGIGLAICSTVCDKHNWTLTANGQVEEGCQFIIRTQPAH